MDTIKTYYDGTELIHIKTSAKSEKWKCIKCNGICYYPHSKGIDGIPYNYCPYCGKEVSIKIIQK